MTEESEPTVPVVCEACATTSEVPLSEVRETITRHNDRLHDGEEIAEVDPAIKEHLVDLVAEDIGIFDDNTQP